MIVAYLTPQYPKVSHTFIRREIQELERRGHDVKRVSLRRPEHALVDEADALEQRRTLYCLAQGAPRLLGAALLVGLSRPVAFLRALRLALRWSRASERGLLRHLAYAVEASWLLRVCRRERVEHVHVHFGTNAAKVARLLRELGGPRYSVTVHGPDEFDAVAAHALPDTVGAAAFAVGVSHYTSAQLQRWLPPDARARIHVVRCTVDERFFEDASPPPDRPDFVCVGRLTPQKGQLLLVGALRRLLDEGLEARVVFAGDGESRAAIEAEVAAAGLASCVEITGWVDETAVRKRLQDARCLVLPSAAEGLPVVLMEALAMHRPVISTYVAGIPELVRPGENGWLVPAGDEEALAAAMRAALRASPQELERMGRAGAERVRARHSLVLEVEKLDRLLRSAAGAA